MTFGGSFVGQFSPVDESQASVAPMGGWTVRGPLAMMLHGEVHNTRALCRDLELAADTPLPDVLRVGWQRWDERLLARLDGAIALAIRDRGRLVLYRDPSGLRSLYWHGGVFGEVAFGSDLNRLVRLPGVSRRVARASLHEYLRFGDIAAPRTVYAGVEALEPGQQVWVRAAGIETRAAPPCETDAKAPAAFDEAVEQLSAHLDRGIAARLAGAARPASFLSGGVDSSLLCALAARQRQDLTALTVGFEGQAFDESPHAARVAAHLGLRHEVMRFDHRDCVAGLRGTAAAEQPSADPATAVTLLAFARCRERFDAVLDGTGADEAVGMMPARHVRLAVAYASLLPASWRACLTRFFRSVPSLAGHAPLLDFEHPAETLMRWRGFTRPEVEALCAEPVSFEQTRFFRTFNGHARRDHFARYTALLDAMPAERLNQATLFTGLAVRYPFCEPMTNCFIRQLPVAHRCLPGQPKRILHALLARHLPPGIGSGPKHGFDFPLQDFLAADSYSLVREHLDLGVWRRHGLLSPEHVASYARRFMSGEAALRFRVWILVQLGAWLGALERSIDH